MFEQESAYAVVTVMPEMISEPVGPLFAPLHPPPASQEEAFAIVQESVDAPPLETDEGSAERVTVGGSSPSAGIHLVPSALSMKPGLQSHAV